MKSCRLLLFDLDGTLLQSDKTISSETEKAIQRCGEKGMLIGVSTSRGEQNALPFFARLRPEVLVTSGGAFVKYRGECLYQVEFSPEEIRRVIALTREVCGANCEITVDTVDAHYWNYRLDPKKQDQSWGDSVYTNFDGFDQSGLKICVEIPEESQALQLQALLPDCDCLRFSGGCWYKFTQKAATKENAIARICEVCGITADEITAFGDDYTDIGMLRLCGTGVAMGNAIDEVKAAADEITGSNDEDGIAGYLERLWQ